MKLLTTSDTRVLLFNGVTFLKLVNKTVNSETPFEGKYTVGLEPVIESEYPTLKRKGNLSNEYELVIYNVIYQDPSNPNKDELIFKTRSSFLYTDENAMSEKELFEHLLTLTDKYTSEHFYSHLRKVQEKLWEIDPKTASTVEKFEFLLVKLGTKYRPFPNIDHRDFFSSVS